MDQILWINLSVLAALLLIRLFLFRRKKDQVLPAQRQDNREESSKDSFPGIFPEPPKDGRGSQVEKNGKTDTLEEAPFNEDLGNYKIRDEGLASPSLENGSSISSSEATAIGNIIVNYSAPAVERLLAIKTAGKLMMTEAVPQLIEVLYDPDAGISSASADSLGKIGDPRAIEPLMEVSRTLDMHLLEDVKKTSDEAPVEVRKSESEPKIEDKNLDANPFKYKELTPFRIDLLPKEYFQMDGTPLPRKELVLRGLKDNDQQLRKMAAKAAIGLSDPELIRPLAETLKNPYEVESVRYLAAEALGGMEDDTAVTTLIESLDDENIAVRYSAATALSKVGGPKASEALVKALADQNEFVRSSVAYALGQLGDQKALDALLGAIHDDNEVVRFSVAKALGNIGGEKVLDGLEESLKAADSSLRSAIIDVLSQIKDEKATLLLRIALRDEDSEVSFRASLALMNQESLEALQDLIDASHRLDQELMNWVNKESRVDLPLSPEDAAFLEIHEIKPGSLKREKEALEKLAVALRHSSPNVRGSAANNLGEFKTPQAVKLLMEALRDSHEYVRSTAVSSLGKIGDPAGLPALLELTNDPSEDVRYSLVRALGNFKSKKTQLALHQLAENDLSKEIKRLARKGLEKY